MKSTLCNQPDKMRFITLEDNVRGIDCKCHGYTVLALCIKIKNGTELGLHMGKAIVEEHSQDTLDAKTLQTGKSLQ